MPDDAAAYLLLVLDLLVVAAILTLPLLLLLWVIGRTRRRSAVAPQRSARTAPPREPQAAPPSGERVLRRCDDCGTGWKAVPGRDSSKTALKVRRWMRRRARARKKHSPGWTKRQGWSRCPSCLSTNVRTSSRHASDA